MTSFPTRWEEWALEFFQTGDCFFHPECESNVTQHHLVVQSGNVLFLVVLRLKIVTEKKVAWWIWNNLRFLNSHRSDAPDGLRWSHSSECGDNLVINHFMSSAHHFIHPIMFSMSCLTPFVRNQLLVLIFSVCGLNAGKKKCSCACSFIFFRPLQTATSCLLFFSEVIGGVIEACSAENLYCSKRSRMETPSAA